ncbi:MAG TPA: hypothetical protein VIK75_04345 [Calditerricola sp.]
MAAVTKTLNGMTWELEHDGPQRVPANESREHYILKQLGVWFLRGLGCEIVVQEVDGFTGNAREVRPRGASNEYGFWTREWLRGPTRIDVAGLRRTYDFNRGEKIGPHTPRMIVYGLEVKVSRSDYLSGYCTSAHVLYIMTPPGLLRPDELPPGIGLVEGDPDKAEVYLWETGGIHRIEGIKVVKKPGRRKDAFEPAHPGDIIFNAVKLFQSRLIRGVGAIADIRTWRYVPDRADEWV